MMDKIIKYIRENYQLFILFSIFIILKIITLSKTHQIIWDESVYIGMGKYIYSFGKSGLWEAIRPIGLPLLLGILWKLKLNTILFSEILIILFSIGNIWITYLIAKHVFNKSTAITSAFILVITPIFFLYSSYILTGIISTFFALIAIYLYFLKKNIKLVGIFVGLAFLFRFPQGLLLIAILLSLFINDLIKKRSIKKTLKKFVRNMPKDYLSFLTTFFITLSPFLLFNFILYRPYTSKVYHAIFRPIILSFSHQSNPLHSIPSIFQNISYYLMYLINENWIFVFLFIAIIFFFKNKEYKNYRITSLLIIIVTYLAYFTLITNKQYRFSLVFLPYLAIFAAYGVISTIKFLKNKKYYLKYSSYSLLIIFAVFSLMHSTDIIDAQFGWRVYEEFPITSEYYKYFSNKHLMDPILTTNPVHSVYSNNGYIPFYFSVNEGALIYTANRNKAKAVIYSPDSFVCYTKECEKKLKDLFSDIQKKFNLVFEKQYYNRTYYIFEKIN